MTVGENIKKIRKEKGLTQKELADKCNIIYQTIGKYERNLLNPKYETLEKIANALDISYFELLDMCKSSETSNNQKITLDVEIRNIDEEIKKAEKLIELLKEAKSLADDLASIDFKIHV